MRVLGGGGGVFVGNELIDGQSRYVCTRGEIGFGLSSHTLTPESITPRVFDVVGR